MTCLKSLLTVFLMGTQLHAAGMTIISSGTFLSPYGSPASARVLLPPPFAGDPCMALAAGSAYAGNPPKQNGGIWAFDVCAGRPLSTDVLPTWPHGSKFASEFSVIVQAAAGNYFFTGNDIATSRSSAFVYKYTPAMWYQQDWTFTAPEGSSQYDSEIGAGAAISGNKLLVTSQEWSSQLHWTDIPTGATGINDFPALPYRYSDGSIRLISYYSITAVDNNEIIVTGLLKNNTSSPHGGLIARLSPATGAVIWKIENFVPGVNSHSQCAAVAGNDLYACMRAGTEMSIWKLNAKDKTLAWKTSLGTSGVLRKIHAYANEILAVGEKAGIQQLWRLNSNTGAITEEISVPLERARDAVLLDNGNKLVAVGGEQTAQYCVLSNKTLRSLNALVAEDLISSLAVKITDAETGSIPAAVTAQCAGTGTSLTRYGDYFFLPIGEKRPAACTFSAAGHQSVSLPVPQSAPYITNYGAGWCIRNQAGWKASAVVLKAGLGECREVCGATHGFTEISHDEYVNLGLGVDLGLVFGIGGQLVRTNHTEYSMEGLPEAERVSLAGKNIWDPDSAALSLKKPADATEVRSAQKQNITALINGVVVSSETGQDISYRFDGACPGGNVKISRWSEVKLKIGAGDMPGLGGDVKFPSTGPQKVEISACKRKNADFHFSYKVQAESQAVTYAGAVPAETSLYPELVKLYNYIITAETPEDLDLTDKRISVLTSAFARSTFTYTRTASSITAEEWDITVDGGLDLIGLGIKLNFGWELEIPYSGARCYGPKMCSLNMPFLQEMTPADMAGLRSKLEASYMKARTEDLAVKATVKPGEIRKVCQKQGCVWVNNTNAYQVTAGIGSASEEEIKYGTLKALTRGAEKVSIRKENSYAKAGFTYERAVPASNGTSTEFGRKLTDLHLLQCVRGECKDITATAASAHPASSAGGNMTFSATAAEDAVFALAAEPQTVACGNRFPYPNPFRPSNGDTGVIFPCLAAASVVKIYTVDGLLVRKLENPVDGAISWNVKNSNGAKLASGVYLYQVDNEKARKLMVLR